MVKKKRDVKKSSIGVDTCCTHHSCSKNSSCGGCFYGLGILGSAFYFLSAATGFWSVILGILKSLVWPAFLVYELFKYLSF